jgi:hypothetical protein
MGVGRRVVLLGLASTMIGWRTARAADPEPGPFMEAGALAARIADVRAGRVRVFHVGPAISFHHHVPSSVRVGDARTEQGYAALCTELRKAAADVDVVLYCGCCPVDHCPNVRPASRAITEVKRARTWVLRLPTNFDRDWVDKGYPVER